MEVYPQRRMEGREGRTVSDLGSRIRGVGMKKQPNTPRSRVKNALRQVWLRSRERAEALKRDGYTCQKCGKKQSRKKGNEVYVEVHHMLSVNWDYIMDAVYDNLLINSEHLVTLCQECHKREDE